MANWGPMILSCIILSDTLLNTDIPYREINIPKEKTKTVNFEVKGKMYPK